MAGEEGFEPSNAGIKIRCLDQLGDSPTQPGTSIVTFNCLRRRTKNFYASVASGCCDKLFAHLPSHSGGNRSSTCCAVCASLNRANTQAPEPVILACGLFC